MKTAIALALLALATPALASTDAEWDCGNNLKAYSGKGTLGVYFRYQGKYDDVDAGPHHPKGLRHFDLQWNFTDGAKSRMQVNGKVCTQTN